MHYETNTNVSGYLAQDTGNYAPYKSYCCAKDPVPAVNGQVDKNLKKLIYYLYETNLIFTFMFVLT